MSATRSPSLLAMNITRGRRNGRRAATDLMVSAGVSAQQYNAGYYKYSLLCTFFKRGVIMVRVLLITLIILPDNVTAFEFSSATARHGLTRLSADRCRFQRFNNIFV